MIYGLRPYGYRPYGMAGETPITPAVGSLTLAGVAPTLFHQALKTPPTYALTLTGVLPIQATASQTFTGSLTFTGYAPNKIASERPEPATAPLALSGTLPLIINPVRITPTVTALAITGYAPIKGFGVIPTTTAKTLTGIASRWDYGLVPPKGSLTLTGYQPTGVGTQAVTVPTGGLVLDGKLPFLQKAAVVIPTGVFAVGRIKFVTVWVQVYDAQVPVWTKIPT